LRITIKKYTITHKQQKNEKMKKKLIAVTLLLAIGLASSLWPGYGLASTGVIYISPASSSVQVSNDITLQLRITPGTPVNAVQATVTYDSADLEYISNSVSAFPVCTEDSGGGGSVNFACAQLSSSTSSDSLIASITFQALAGSGSTTIGVSGANAAYNGTYTDPGSSGGTVSFTSPAPPPSTPPKSSSGSGSHSSSSTKSNSSSNTSSGSNSNSSSTTSTTTPSTTSTQTPTTPTQKVSISSNPKTLEFNTVILQVTTNVLVQTYVKFGTNPTNLNSSTTPSAMSKSTSINLGSSLVPGTTYYYQVYAQDSNGNVTKGPIEHFTTKGYTVGVTIFDDENHPLANKIVTLHSTPMTSKTNSKGLATFYNVAPGVHHLEYSVSDHTYSETVYVANYVLSDNNKEVAAPQTAAVILAGYVQSKTNDTWSYILIGIVTVTIILVIIRLIPDIKLLKNKQATEKKSVLISRPNKV
jgi:hypothetical protein